MVVAGLSAPATGLPHEGGADPSRPR
jgi:hypothetical protein